MSDKKLSTFAKTNYQRYTVNSRTHARVGSRVSFSGFVLDFYQQRPTQ